MFTARANVVPTLPLDGVAATPWTPTRVGCNTGRRYPEQAPDTGATTFAGPYEFGGRGPRVAFGQRIEVICPLYAPSGETVDPGYWYLVAPRRGTAATTRRRTATFNGGTGRHDTAHPDPDVDPAVPDCCAPDRPCNF